MKQRCDSCLVITGALCTNTGEGTHAVLHIRSFFCSHYCLHDLCTTPNMRRQFASQRSFHLASRSTSGLEHSSALADATSVFSHGSQLWSSNLEYPNPAVCLRRFHTSVTTVGPDVTALGMPGCRHLKVFKCLLVHCAAQETCDEYCSKDNLSKNDPW